MKETTYGFVVVSKQGKDVTGRGTKDSVNKIKHHLMRLLEPIRKHEGTSPRFLCLVNSLFALDDIQAVVFEKHSDDDIDFTVNIGTEV